MLDGMVTVEVVPLGTSRKAISSGRIRKSMIIVPIDNVSMNSFKSLENDDGDKWEHLLNDPDLNFLRPMTMGSVIGGMTPDGDEAWKREARTMRSMMRDGMVFRVTLVASDDDTGEAWSFIMPKPSEDNLHMLLGL